MHFIRAFLIITGLSLSLRAAATQPCTAGSAGETVLPVKSASSGTTYCVSDFGWSDTWFKGAPTTYSSSADVFSGEDSFNLKWSGSTGSGYFSPSMDVGTRAPRLTSSVAGLGASQWSIVNPLAYVAGSGNTQAQSKIGHASGLQVTITTTSVGKLVTVKFDIYNSGTNTVENVIFSDYFNFHPNGSGSSTAARRGSTQYNAVCPASIGPCSGVITTEGQDTVSGYISDGFIYGERAPDAWGIGYASGVPTGQTALYLQLANSQFNMSNSRLGPADTAGIIAWNLGNLSAGSTTSFTVYKGLFETPEPGTVVLIGGGLAVIWYRRRKTSAS